MKSSVLFFYFSVETPIGYMPTKESLDVTGLGMKPEALDELFHVNKTEWSQEITRFKEFQNMFGDRMPAELKAETAKLESRINSLPFL